VATWQGQGGRLTLGFRCFHQIPGQPKKNLGIMFLKSCDRCLANSTEAYAKTQSIR